MKRYFKIKAGNTETNSLIEDEIALDDNEHLENILRKTTESIKRRAVLADLKFRCNNVGDDMWFREVVAFTTEISESDYLKIKNQKENI